MLSFSKILSLKKLKITIRRGQNRELYEAIRSSLSDL